jgi:hypothetical protein
MADEGVLTANTTLRHPLKADGSIEIQTLSQRDSFGAGFCQAEAIDFASLGKRSRCTNAESRNFGRYGGRQFLLSSPQAVGGDPRLQSGSFEGGSRCTGSRKAGQAARSVRE